MDDLFGFLAAGGADIAPQLFFLVSHLSGGRETRCVTFDVSSPPDDFFPLNTTFPFTVKAI